MTPFQLSRFAGVFPAVMTFFDSEGNLDESATLAHWQWLIDHGVDGLVVAGTSGEFIALSLDEQLRVIRWAVDLTGGKLPVIAGTGHTTTKFTVELSQKAQDMGADAVMAILPYYSRPPIEGVIEHYRTLRRHVDLPIMLYNNPGNTACAALSPQQVVQLVEDDVVHLIKSTMESVVPIHELASEVGDRLRIFYGSFLAAYEGLAAGAHGWISGVLNVAAPLALRMDRALRVDRDIDTAFRIWKRILPIVRLYTHQAVGPALDLPIYRGMLNIWGRTGGYSRAPLWPLTDNQMQQLRSRLAECDWLEPPQA